MPGVVRADSGQQIDHADQESDNAGGGVGGGGAVGGGGGGGGGEGFWPAWIAEAYQNEEQEEQDPYVIPEEEEEERDSYVIPEDELGPYVI